MIVLHSSMELLNFSLIIILQLFNFLTILYLCFMKHLFTFIVSLFCLRTLVFRLNWMIVKEIAIQNYLIFQGNIVIYIQCISKFFSFEFFHLQMIKMFINLCINNFEIYLMNFEISCSNLFLIEQHFFTNLNEVLNFSNYRKWVKCFDPVKANLSDELKKYHFFLTEELYSLIQSQSNIFYHLISNHFLYLFYLYLFKLFQSLFFPLYQ